MENKGKLILNAVIEQCSRLHYRYSTISQTISIIIIIIIIIITITKRINHMNARFKLFSQFSLL